MSLFKNRFISLLEQEEPVTVPNQEEGEMALQGELEDGTSPDDLGAKMPAGADIESIRKQTDAGQQEELKVWISKLSEFVNFLNDPNNKESVHNKLQDSGCDSLFEKIASSEHKRISRVASEIASLVQSLNGFLIAGNDQ